MGLEKSLLKKEAGMSTSTIQTRKMEIEQELANLIAAVNLNMSEEDQRIFEDKIAWSAAVLNSYNVMLGLPPRTHVKNWQKMEWSELNHAIAEAERKVTNG